MPNTRAQQWFRKLTASMVITTCNLIFLISSVSGNIYIIYVIKNFQTEMTLDLSKAQTAIKAIM